MKIITQVKDFWSKQNSKILALKTDHLFGFSTTAMQSPVFSGWMVDQLTATNSPSLTKIGIRALTQAAQKFSNTEMEEILYSNYHKLKSVLKQPRKSAQFYSLNRALSLWILQKNDIYSTQFIRELFR